MVRKSTRVVGRLAVSAALSWTLIPIAVADAPAPSPQPTSQNSTSGATGAQSKTKLYTVPEDGMGDTEWLSGATRIVRELTLKRPKEDLIICIAGCVGKQDRVVYAQPTEARPPKPADDLMSGAAAQTPAPSAAVEAPANAASANADPAKPVAQPAANMAPAAEAVQVPEPMNSAPSNAAADAEGKTNEFVPSMSAPAGEEKPDENPYDPAKPADASEKPASDEAASNSDADAVSEPK